MATQPISCDGRDLPGDSLGQLARKDLATVKGMEHMALGELLTLPQNFG